MTYQVPWACCQPWKHGHDGPYYQNHCSREYNGYLGIWPSTTQQLGAWRIIGHSCGNLHHCHQGMSHYTMYSLSLANLVLLLDSSSGQWIEYFEKLQIQCKINNLLRIPLHSNICWVLPTLCLIDHLPSIMLVKSAFYGYIYWLPHILLTISSVLMLCMDQSLLSIKMVES